MAATSVVLLLVLVAPSLALDTIIIGGESVHASELGTDIVLEHPSFDVRPRLLPRRQPPTFPASRYLEPLSHLDPPASFDWRDHGAVTPVRDQGSVGTCWAFSTVGAIESQRILAGHAPEELSVEQVVDCDATRDPTNIHADCGVFGGWPYLAYQYVERQGGLNSEADYNYCSGSGKCYPCAADGYNKTVCGPPVEYCLKNESCTARLKPSEFVNGSRVRSWSAVQPDEKQMQLALVARGPLSILIDATGLSFYKSGIWGPRFCSKTTTDHAVLLIGYGSQDGKDYWIVKNSWGVKWGMDGFFLMERGKDMCAITSSVTVPAV